MKRRHSVCLFDLCNFSGSNGGAWADLYGDDLIVFGGMWHGNWTDHREPQKSDCYDYQLWMPGAGPKERSTHALPSGEVYMDSSMNSSIIFGALGDVSALVKAFNDEARIAPEHFRGCSIVSIVDIEILIDER